MPRVNPFVNPFVNLFVGMATVMAGFFVPLFMLLINHSERLGGLGATVETTQAEHAGRLARLEVRIEARMDDIEAAIAALARDVAATNERMARIEGTVAGALGRPFPEGTVAGALGRSFPEGTVADALGRPFPEGMVAGALGRPFPEGTITGTLGYSTGRFGYYTGPQLAWQPYDSGYATIGGFGYSTGRYTGPQLAWQH